MPRKKDPTEGLPDLTENQRNFVYGILEGRTKSDAYRAAYNTEGMQDSTIWANASALSRNNKVARWVNYIKAQNVERGSYTLADHVDELEEAKEWLKSINNGGAYVRAVELKGKATGLYVERIKHEHDHSAQDLIDEGIARYGDAFLQTKAYERLSKRLH